MAEVIGVSLPAMVGGQRASWTALIELSSVPGSNWTLAGGQLVFLHQIERGASDVRPTDDVDVVVDIRVEPLGLTRVHTVLIEAGFVQDLPGPEGTAHRYRREAATFDVLAPDNVGARAKLAIGSGRTVQAPGATQPSSAQRRSSNWRDQPNKLRYPSTAAPIRIDATAVFTESTAVAVWLALCGSTPIGIMVSSRFRNH